jgi:hypothetical protein
MKHIKKINELFDDSDIKSKYEIPYLQGEFDLNYIVNNKSFIKNGDNLLSKLSINCPYIGKLGFNRLSKNLLNIGFNKNLENVFLYFVIEIVDHDFSKSYLCNCYAKCIKNGESIYDEKISKSLINYNDLVDLMNGKILDILIDFTKFSDKNFNYKGFPYTNREYMKGLNLGRN